MQSAQGKTYIELSVIDGVSITRSREQILDYPANAIVLTRKENLLAALQKLYPDFWFSAMTELPEGDFDVVLIPNEGEELDQAQQQHLIQRAYEQSFKVRILLSKDDKVATIKGRIL